MKKIIGILFVLMLLLPYSTGVVYASELDTQEEITRENLEKVELYQILDSYLRETELSIELFSETQIDFENLTYEAPETV